MRGLAHLPADCAKAVATRPQVVSGSGPGGVSIAKLLALMFALFLTVSQAHATDDLAPLSATMAAAVRAHLEATQDYRDLSALYNRNVATNPGWIQSPEGQAVYAQLQGWRKDASAVRIIRASIKYGEGSALTREFQYSIGGALVTDEGIGVADLDESRPYRETIAKAVAENILTSPMDAKVTAALASFRSEPVARQSLADGLQAAREQKWQLAILHFEGARALMPDSPEIFGDLGLAESRIPGRELRAIAWFGAYLTAQPNAPNAAAVQAEIAQLLAKDNENKARFVKTMEALALNMPNPADHSPHTPGYRRDFAICRTGSDYAQLDDLADARRMLAATQNQVMKDGIQIAIVEAQLRAGDMSGAKRTFRSIRDDLSKSAAADAFLKSAERATAPHEAAAPLTVQDWTGLLDGELGKVYAKNLSGYLESTPNVDATYGPVGYWDTAFWNTVLLRRAVQELLDRQTKQQEPP